MCRNTTNAPASDRNFKYQIKYNICLIAEKIINSWKLLIFFQVQET